jgi:4-hydroxythreonine-4-phosphate dehydrogenase
LLQFKKIIITSGDWDGIGTEVTAKALFHLKCKKPISFIFFRSSKIPKSHLNLIDRKYKRTVVSTLKEALQVPFFKNQIIDINSHDRPAQWVEQSAIATYRSQCAALVTGPLSKTEILRSGMTDMGHTDILKRVSGTKVVFMTFLGKYLNVLSLTGHIPLSLVASSLKPKLLFNAFRLGTDLSLKLPKKNIKGIGILGLNPHSGESGLIGSEESKIIQPALYKWNSSDLFSTSTKVYGPLVPDVTFMPHTIEKFNLYIAIYHDQALIPFKMLHGQSSGVHLSLGLPFIRTSVDHGTAKDIFNKDKANYGSMLDALNYAIKFAK